MCRISPEPTDDQVVSACYSYRHDFGLLAGDEQDRIRCEARSWLIAWMKEFGAYV